MNQYLLVGEKNRLKINRYTDNGVYLICAEEDEVKIRLSEEEEKQLFYYED